MANSLYGHIVYLGIRFPSGTRWVFRSSSWKWAHRVLDHLEGGGGLS
jgi:hypothetical protein